jgi:hypothetical protein
MTLQYRHVCPDCAVPAGRLHDIGCDVERCSLCGMQRIGCDCDQDQNPYPRLAWTGIWPGESDCEEYGFFSYWSAGKGWVACGPDHPNAGPDLNRLVGTCRWDPDQARLLLTT